MIYKKHRFDYYLRLTIHEKINLKVKNKPWDSIHRTHGDVYYFIFNAPSYVVFLK